MLHGDAEGTPHVPPLHIPLSGQGLLEQRGACVPPEQCDCLHTNGSGGPVALPAGSSVLLGCKKW